MGKIAGGMVGVDFDTYRSFHLEHHRFTNTPKDPERHFYMDATYLELIAPWQGLTISRKITQIFRVVRHLAGALTALGGKSAFVKAVGWFIPLAILGTGYLQGLSLFAVLARVVVAWYLPLFMLLFVEIAVSQSEHYGTEAVEGSSGHGAVPNEVQYGVSWNLHVPAIVRFLLLARNLHAEHHLVPAIHWSQARDQDCGRTLRARDYLHMLWSRGPRT